LSSTDALRPSVTTTALLTATALLAFAANSLLTRAALSPPIIDPLAFAAIRVSAGAATLAILTRGRLSMSGRARWIGPTALLLYLIPFTLAYVRLGAATGALLLFGAVQATMIVWSVWRGDRPVLMTWVGLLIAVLGLVALVAPVLRSPDAVGVVLMTIAGMAWGAYTITGRGTGDALGANAFAFACVTPAALAYWLVGRGELVNTSRGVWLAVASGALASGVGYAIWFRALRGLRTTQAATVQLSVPVIAAVGGVLLLNEPLTTRLVLCGVAVLSGIVLVLRARR
jgi:drug/metabolite transporter (DMT)-like permease